LLYFVVFVRTFNDYTRARAPLDYTTIWRTHQCNQKQLWTSSPATHTCHFVRLAVQMLSWADLKLANTLYMTLQAGMLQPDLLRPVT
jgi:hypothetical protein